MVIKKWNSNNGRKAYHGLQAWPHNQDMLQGMKNGLTKTLPGLNDFSMGGQYSMGMVGLMTAALCGWNLIKDVGRKEGRRFTTRLAI